MDKLNDHDGDHTSVLTNDAIILSIENIPFKTTDVDREN